MALKSTIFKAELSVSDMDRPYYGSHTLTIAQHPSENDAASTSPTNPISGTRR
jgi:uncharacterized protein YaeQ